MLKKASNIVANNLCKLICVCACLKKNAEYLNYIYCANFNF